MKRPGPGPRYLDPATGTYVIQMAIAGVLAAFYAMKDYWGALLARLRGGEEEKGEGEGEGEGEPEPEPAEAPESAPE